MFFYHNQYDAFISKNCFAWQHWMLNKFCDQIFKIVKKFKHFKISKIVRDEILETQKTNEKILISTKMNFFFKSIWKKLTIQFETIVDLKKYFHIQIAFTNIFDQIDSKIETNKTLFNMFFVNKNLEKNFDVNECKMLKKCKITFYNS